VTRSHRAAFGAVLGFLSVAFLAERPALAQKPTFEIEGAVLDAQQAVLPGVTITIQNVSTGLARTTATDQNGRYVFAALPPEGKYRLQLDIAGFATEIRSDLTFNAGQRVVLNFTMKLSNVQETVTVAGGAPIVQTTSAEVTRTINNKDFETLPVKERNYFRLLTLDSNVVARSPGTNAVNVGGGEVWNFGTYNMVRWYQDTESGGLLLPGTGYLWDNNVDTVHGTFTTIASDRLLNEVRGQFSRYADRRTAKCDCVQRNRAGYSVTGGVADGTWGVGAADSATSGFFICINDQPSVDFGGMRNADGQGFAAFGHVVRGMDVVRRIQQAPNTDAQSLTPPVKIIAVTRP